MSKRNITFSKPAEPTFLRKLKEEAGYKEGPTVDTKRENLGNVLSDDLVDTQEELPTVVVLKPGDLTEEEASNYKKQLEKEENEKPADLSLPVVFKARGKVKKAPEASIDSSKPPQKKKKSEKKNLSLLSFPTEDDE